MAEEGKGRAIEDWTSRQRDLTRRVWDFLNDRDPLGLPVTRWFGEESGFVMPKLDISETDKEMEITVELPGMTEKDVDLEIHNGVLTIKGEKKEEKEKKDKTYHRMERTYGSFQRSFSLPPTVDEDKVEADFENGILTITLVKKRAEEPAKKKIKIGGK